MINLKALVILQLVLGAVSECLNDPTFQQSSPVDSGDLKHCKEIRNKEERRQSLCPIQTVNEACPQACGTCCEDDVDFTFKIKNKEKNVGCDWILSGASPVLGHFPLVL